jgi:hypothetical protein
MGQLVLGVAGAVVGSFVPGVGTAIGWAIGSTLGALAFPAKKPNQYNVQTPNADLRMMRAEYGAQIPYIRGAMRIAPILAWNSALQPVQTVTVTPGGGKGGGGGDTFNVTITYKRDILFLLSNNAGAGVARVFKNGALVWTADAAAGVTSVAASSAAGHFDRITFYDGNASQQPDPTYEAQVVDNTGALDPTLACAYRGRSTVFLQGVDCGQSGQMANWTFEFVADGTTASVALAALLEGTSSSDAYSINTPRTLLGTVEAGFVWITHDTGDADYYLLEFINAATGAVLFSTRTDIFGTRAQWGGVRAIDSECNAYFFIGTRIWRVKINGETDYKNVDISATGGAAISALAVGADNLVWLIANTGIVAKLPDFDESGIDLTATAVAGDQFSFFLRNAGQWSGRIYGKIVSSGRIGYIDATAMAYTDTGIVITGVGSYPAPLIGRDGNIYVVVSGTLKKFDLEGVLLDSEAYANCEVYLHDSDGFLWLKDTTSGVAWKKVLASTLALDSTVTANGFTDCISEYAAGQPAFWGLTATAGDFGKLGISEQIERVTKVPPSVEDVVSDICEVCELTASQFDATALSSITKTVDCFVWAGGTSGRSAIEQLMASHFFEAVPGAKIVFVPRGGSSVASIPYADLGATLGDDQPEPLALKESNELEIPAQIALTYPNIDNDYQPDTQYSDRLISAAAGTVAGVSMTVGMTPAQAKAVADTMLLDMTASRWSTSLALLGDYAALEPTDVVTVTGDDGSTFRLRLVKKTDSYPLLQFEAVLDDASVLLSQGITSADYESSTEVASPADTILRILDIPILRDSDDNAGPYVATKGNVTPYPGAAIFTSTDDVEYTFQTTVDESAVFGVCTTVLGDWSGGRAFDEGNSVTVDVGDGTLATTTRAALLDSLAVNTMLIGDEILQFRTATLVSAGIYTLAGLLRGGRGTEWAMTGHIAGERAVLLRAAGLRRVAMQNAEIGLTRYFKGVTRGRALSTAPSAAFVNAAVGLKPFAPLYGKVARDASNNATLTCQRRTRLNVRMIGSLGINVPLGEDEENYHVKIYSSSGYTTVLRTILVEGSVLGVPTASYTAAQQTADGLTPGNTIYHKWFQVSGTVGEGYGLAVAA